MTEIWKTYKETSWRGQKRIYKVSNLGNAMLNGQLIDFKNQVTSNSGYYRLAGPNLLHRIVAELFVPNPDNKHYVDHINTIKTDNRAVNLRWVTAKENSNNPITKKHNSISNKGKHNGEKNPMYGKNAHDFMTPEAVKEANRKRSESLRGRIPHNKNKHKVWDNKELNIYHYE